MRLKERVPPARKSLLLNGNRSHTRIRGRQLPEPHRSIITHSKFRATSGSRPYVLQSALHLVSVQKPARAHRPNPISHNHLMPKLRVFKLVSRVICLPWSRITGGDGVVCATKRVSVGKKKKKITARSYLRDVHYYKRQPNATRRARVLSSRTSAREERFPRALVPNERYKWEIEKIELQRLLKGGNIESERHPAVCREEGIPRNSTSIINTSLTFEYFYRTLPLRTRECVLHADTGVRAYLLNPA